MSSISPLNSALLGITRGLNGLKQDAAEIASAKAMSAGTPKDITSPLIRLIEDRSQVAASVKVITAIDQALGSLLDVKA